MPKSIAINGVKLKDVRMLLVPYDNGTVSYQSYPDSQFHCSQNANMLTLAIPARVALELYRTGILHQNTDIPVSVKFGGTPAKEYLVTDVRYPNSSVSYIDHIQFTLTSIPKNAASIPPSQ